MREKNIRKKTKGVIPYPIQLHGEVLQKRNVIKLALNSIFILAYISINNTTHLIQVFLSNINKQKQQFL